jgi:hypothetical protein
MDYIPVYESEEPDDGKTVKVSLDKVQRSGVRTEAVEARVIVRPVRAVGTVMHDESRLTIVALAEEDAGLDRVGLARTNALSPGVADAPRQTGRDHHLMQLALVHQVLERKRGRVEPRALGDSPVSVNPSALDSDGKRRCDQPRERPADAVIRDIRTFARMLEARHGRKYQFVHDRRIVKRKRAGKDPVADDPVCLSCMGDCEQRCSEQPSHPTVDAFVSDPKVMCRPLLPWSGGARPSIMREHENLMPDLSKARAWPS